MGPTDKVDITIACHCGKTFIWPVKDQDFFERMGFQPPKNCPECKKVKNQQRGAKPNDRQQDNRGRNNSFEDAREYEDFNNTGGPGRY